jgi:hypothetical protein
LPIFHSQGFNYVDKRSQAEGASDYSSFIVTKLFNNIRLQKVVENIEWQIITGVFSGPA